MNKGQLISSINQEKSYQEENDATKTRHKVEEPTAQRADNEMSFIGFASDVFIGLAFTELTSATDYWGK